jgi:hypothetical protein
VLAPDGLERSRVTELNSFDLFLFAGDENIAMAEKAHSTASVSNGTNGGPSKRPPLKKQDSDKDFDDYFVCLLFFSFLSMAAPCIH